MLKKVTPSRLTAPGGAYAIVASRYNGRYVDAMVRAAQIELKRAGARRIQLIRVPGAYEIPIVAASLARSTQARPDAILCLGIIFRGETVHAALIGDAVSRGLMQIQISHGVPVIFEVLLLENELQAKARCLGRTRNRGAEAAQTAIEMVGVMQQVPFERG